MGTVLLMWGVKEIMEAIGQKSDVQIAVDWRFEKESKMGYQELGSKGEIQNHIYSMPGRIFIIRNASSLISIRVGHSPDFTHAGHFSH